MKQNSMQSSLVEYIPEYLAEGIVYVSKKYRTAAHRCCCGCGEEVITPLGPAEWSLQIVNGKVTLYPSVGNWSFPCQSHYWIRNGKVLWAHTMTKHQIQQVRRREQHMREAYYSKSNTDQVVISSPPVPLNQVENEEYPSLLKTILLFLKNLLGLK